ncbi:dTDP-4-dehydrorhamnose reductase [Microbulbifer aggregans]|uniref:dTDP-4-dehydrorhamnose reductase n=1 Tax=Microbulbifer aggregans TaxID=1769779 RepID=A0A1C9W7S6_9GAMM|nr:dTDP-4-dehydrorhamnose reductase [Microbulbifer aggregans]AOS97183.1 dTDP-4-dehydrorhamnose reductase [Microbulbifer aggregans]
MKLLIVGKNGQLAQELVKRKPEGIELIALGRKEMDITDASTTMEVVGQYSPDLVINAAAYTAVDRAEEERALAFDVNARGAEQLAWACREFRARLIHVSTDFVFDGRQSRPYGEEDGVRPLNVYGLSKAAGEAVVRSILPEAIIIRTAWVYSAHGSNFLNTMLRLMNERDQLGVVSDQVGTPTSTRTLADTIYHLAGQPNCQGIYHCTDEGVASWYDFAVAILEEGRSAGLLPQERAVAIKPISTAEYPTPAKRPAYSVLDKRRLTEELGVELAHWRQALREVLQEKVSGENASQ